MKDHLKRELVNMLAEIATTYGETQQLRERLRPVIIAAIEQQDRDTREACAKAVLLCELVPIDDITIKVQDAYNACLKAKAL